MNVQQDSGSQVLENPKTPIGQARVLSNVVITGALCGIVLWFVRTQMMQHRGALLCGVCAGLVVGLFRWWRLSRKVTRRDRRFARNKVFVHYLSVLEVILTAIAFKLFLVIPIVLVGVGIVLAIVFAGVWLVVIVASFGAVSSLVLALCVMVFECRHGPIRYQYDNRWWDGWLQGAGSASKESCGRPSRLSARPSRWVYRWRFSMWMASLSPSMSCHPPPSRRDFR